MVRELSGSEVEALRIELVLQEIIRAAENLPPFPDVAWKVMMQVRKNAPVKEVANVTRQHKTIAKKVVSLAQSTVCGRRSGVSSLEDAVSVLGGNRFILATMTACACKYFESKVGGTAVRNRALWKHSVSTAIIGERIARHLEHPKLLTIYTAGLLHDIAKTVLDFYAEIYLHTTLDKIRGLGAAELKAERRVLGIDHQELGEVIARRWRLPPDIITAIAYHHSPHKAGLHSYIAMIVHAADSYAKHKNWGSETLETRRLKEHSIGQRLGIDEQWARALESEVAEEVEAVESTLMRAE
jgi:putative nucleotidyltransferase with HDIG domain